MKLYDLTLHQVGKKLRKKEISSVELTKIIFDRIKETEDKVESFITLTEDFAIKSAQKVDEKIARGENISPLAGIPMSVKDNICTKGIRTTCASKMLENFIPPYNAVAFENMLNCGAVMVGKVNMDEFAFGSSTESSAFRKTKNPWDLTRVAGGSSGGSASSVSSGQSFYSLGSDTGGSVKQPCAFNGLVGLRPTYGRISRYGLIAFASSLDQIGICAKDSLDCFSIFSNLVGTKSMDSTYLERKVLDFTSFSNSSIKGLKIGIPKEYFNEGIDVQIRVAIKDALKILEDRGAIIEEISLAHTEYAIATYYIVASCEASSNLSRFDGIRYGYRAKDYSNLEEMYIKTRSEGFGDEVKRRIIIGTYALSSKFYDDYYVKALKVRTLIKQDFERAFENVDVIITPTTPKVAFKIGEKTSNPLSMYMEDLCTIPSCLAGVPAVSIPCGFKDGVPIGMQIIGDYFNEEKILKVANTFEMLTDFKDKRAQL